jgi:hypothetical protein
MSDDGRVCGRPGNVEASSAGLPGTQPLYSWYSESEKSHFRANSQDWDHLGNQEALLGYDLKE